LSVFLGTKTAADMLLLQGCHLVGTCSSVKRPGWQSHFGKKSYQ